MTPRYLLDTNVLVYLHDTRDERKRLRAAEIVRRVGTARTAALPAQALAELASVALRKLRPPIPADALYTQIESLERAFTVLPLTPAVVLEAVRGVRERKLSYDDAQIWAAAKLGQIPYVLSEDFTNGSVLEGVTFLDPFAPRFDPALL